jgi:G3E family GTPase
MDKRIPVTVLTGDSGVGKTTLLNRILSGDHGRRYAIVLNDLGNFSDFGIDSKFILRTEEELFEMNNGCVCCMIRGDLIRTLQGLLQEQTGNFDAIIIETTGMADPGPVVQTFFIDHILEQHTQLDSIATLVDANTIMQRLRDSRHAMQQVAFADQIVLNKTELLDEETLAAIEARLRRINPLATIHRAQYADVALDKLLERGAYDLTRGAALPPNFLASGAASAGQDGDSGQTNSDTDNDSDDIGSIALRTDVPMNYERIDDWLAALVLRRGVDIVRGKGVIDVVDAGGEQRRLAFQSVQMLHEGSVLRSRAADAQSGSCVVFVGRNLDRAALQTGFMSCAAAGVSASLIPAA